MKSLKVEKPQVSQPEKPKGEEILFEDTIIIEDPNKTQATKPSNLKTIDIQFYSKQNCFSKPKADSKGKTPFHINQLQSKFEGD